MNPDTLPNGGQTTLPPILPLWRMKPLSLSMWTVRLENLTAGQQSATLSTLLPLGVPHQITVSIFIIKALKTHYALCLESISNEDINTSWPLPPNYLPGLTSGGDH